MRYIGDTLVFPDEIQNTDQKTSGKRGMLGLPCPPHISCRGREISPASRSSARGEERLAWFDFYRANGEMPALTCRHFGITASVSTNGRNAYNPFDLTTLEDASKRPLKQGDGRYLALKIAHQGIAQRKHIRWGK